jgi:hypothetical protein
MSATCAARDQPSADREQDQPQADLPGAEQHQPQHVWAGDVRALGERERCRNDQQHQLSQDGGRRHRHIAAVASDDDANGKTERHHDRQSTPERAAAARRADHHADPEQRDEHRDRCAPTHRLAQQRPSQQRRQHRRDRLDEKHLRHRGMVQRNDEGPRGDRQRHRKPEAGIAERAARFADPAAFDDRDVSRHGYSGKQRPSRHLRCHTHRQLALKHARR